MADSMSYEELDAALEKVHEALNNVFQSGPYVAVVVDRKPSDLGHHVVYEIQRKGNPQSLHSIVLSMLPSRAHEVAEGLNALESVGDSFNE